MDSLTTAVLLLSNGITLLLVSMIFHTIRKTNRK